MDVLHDWADEQCVAILHAIRRAAPDSATLLVVEDLIPERPADPSASTLDIIRLTTTGGRERTVDQLSNLFDTEQCRNADPTAATPTEGSRLEEHPEHPRHHLRRPTQHQLAVALTQKSGQTHRASQEGVPWPADMRDVGQDQNATAASGRCLA
jgi:O-methyltransferase domain